MMSPKLSRSDALNGLDGTNGFLGPPQLPNTIFQAKGPVSPFAFSHNPSNNLSTTNTANKHASGAGSHKIGSVQERANQLKKRSSAELGAGVYQSMSDVSYVKFLEWIRAERLTTLPPKGSQRDKVLNRSLYFAEQLHKFDQAIQSFALDSSAAAIIGYGHAQLLLEVQDHSSMFGAVLYPS
jgi:hypothetical protein